MTTPFRRVPRLALAAALTGVLAGGCGSMQDDADFGRELAAELRTPDIALRRDTGAVLRITLYNSPLADPPSSATRETCRRVAEYVRDHYGGYKYLRVVQVAFGSRRGTVTVASSDSKCRFETRELGSPREGAAGSD